MEFHIGVDLHGAIVSGFAVEEMHRYKLGVEEVIAKRGVSMIRAYLPTQYMYLGHDGGNPESNPVPPDAGALAASITNELSTEESQVIRGDLVHYGAWIEGTDTLNAKVWEGRVDRGLSARFPGYHTFRIIAQELDKMAGDIAERELPRYIEAINVY